MIATHFSHVALSCKDPIAVEQFYTRYFGFRRARVIELANDQIVFIKAENIYLELFRANQDAPALPARDSGPEYPALKHIAFQVEDVDAKLAEIGDAAPITLGPLNFDSFIPGWRTAWIADPTGNIVEISQGYTDQT
jgi:glyoxylase I family protein